ncbi:MAG: helicase, partial [Pseudolabrys sp.]
THAELAVTLYGFLMREGSIPTDWLARQVALADRTDGGIDTLSNRIAHVRTWTFAANRQDWLADPEHWQGVTRAVEDKLSDALHERLSERFIDRRTSVLMRRLRENAMLETEIGKSGEVTVEGHAIGRLDGFVFAPDASAAGSEARALNAAAQKVLAGEIEARATRLSQAPNEQIVLANDGAVRWNGDIVGKLVAGDDTLRPRVCIVADEHLTGPPRELVQTRLDLWLKTYVERLLAPLFSLSAAEDVTGIARGIAFQLVEALGVLERQKVAAEVKGLDQPARATLRKYGVRFGAYHIYLPLLLKPAPRSLATQLWALKNERPDVQGVDDLLHLAASGRTSIPVGKDAAKPLYRTAGYRVCGERAVRVDILERLADLIRPALAWREGMNGEKPAGAFDGRGFTVTGAMTSLTGASGEDFASILRSLGYRMDRRPKLPEPTATPPEAAPATAAEAAPVSTEAAVNDAVDADPPEAASESSASLLPAADIGLPAGSAPTEPAVADAANDAASTAAKSAATDKNDASDAAGDAAPAEIHAAEDGAASPAAEKPAEPDDGMVEVWRPAGRSDHRPRQKRPRRRSDVPQPSTQAPAQAPAEAAAGGEGAAAQGAGQSGGPGEAPGERRRERPRRAPYDRAKQRTEKGDRGEQEGGRREERRHRGKGPDRGKDRRDRQDRGDRIYARAGDERRGKEPDPNSPFAKLAALKQQLEASTKDSS